MKTQRKPAEVSKVRQPHTVHGEHEELYYARQRYRTFKARRKQIPTERKTSRLTSESIEIATLSLSMNKGGALRWSFSLSVKKEGRDI